MFLDYRSKRINKLKERLNLLIDKQIILNSSIKDMEEMIKNPNLVNQFQINIAILYKFKDELKEVNEKIANLEKRINIIS